jgi:predicted Rossmann fold nucleotide-binding protein DprA/Smf involved in DNA uptake
MMPRQLSTARPTVQVKDLSPEEETVYAMVGSEPLTIDELTMRAALPSAVMASLLVQLELKNAIQQLPGQRYHRFH